MRFGYLDDRATRDHGRPMVRLNVGDDDHLVARARSIDTGESMGVVAHYALQFWLRDNIGHKDCWVVNDRRWNDFMFLVFRTEAAQFHFKMRWETPK